MSPTDPCALCGVTREDHKRSGRLGLHEFAEGTPMTTKVRVLLDALGKIEREALRSNGSSCNGDSFNFVRIAKMAREAQE